MRKGKLSVVWGQPSSYICDDKVYTPNHTINIKENTLSILGVHEGVSMFAPPLPPKDIKRKMLYRVQRKKRWFFFMQVVIDGVSLPIQTVSQSKKTAQTLRSICQGITHSACADMMVVANEALNSLGKVIDQFNEHVQHNYLRTETYRKIQEDINTHTVNLNKWLDFMKVIKWDGEDAQNIQNKLSYISEIFGEDELAKHQNAFVQSEMERYKEFFNEVESNPLMEDQRIAAIINDKHNLVLAAAGTGKTSVMVARALYLILYKGVKPNEIIMLAFGKNAAAELRERMKTAVKKLNTKGITVNIDESEIQNIASTFHSFGLKVVRSYDSTIELSGLRIDSTTEEQTKDKFHQWTLKSILEYVKEHGWGKTAPSLCTIAKKEQTKSKEEYKEYLERLSLITLNGDYVFNQQELEIGNWLYEYKLNVSYGKNAYGKELALKKKNGAWVRMNDWKSPKVWRAFKVEQDTKSIMIYASTLYTKDLLNEIKAAHEEMGEAVFIWNNSQDTLKIKEALSSHGFVLEKHSKKDFFDNLKANALISTFAKKLSDAISTAKSEWLSEDDIKAKIKKLNLSNEQYFIKLFLYLFKAYKNKLDEDGKIDFDDMIQKAAQYIDGGSDKSLCKYVLVDEFQDISSARFKMLQAIEKQQQDFTLTAVGDDWQSIYRFSGGDIKISTQFNEYFGDGMYDKNKEPARISNAWRYHPTIADVAGNFVMKNKTQHIKRITGKGKWELGDKTSIFIRHKDNAIDRIKWLLENDPIDKYMKKFSTDEERKANPYLLVISPLNKTHKEFMSTLKKEKPVWKALSNSVDGKSIHRSKGAEARHVFILGLNRKFPTNWISNEVQDSFLPVLSEEKKHPESRRIFYVALTRAKQTLHLFYDNDGVSDFIAEIVEDSSKGQIDRLDEYKEAIKKPLCTHCGEPITRRNEPQKNDKHFCSNNQCSAQYEPCEHCHSQGRYKGKGYPLFSGEDTCRLCGNKVKVNA